MKGRTQATKYYYIRVCKKFARVGTRAKEIYLSTEPHRKQQKQVNALQTRFDFIVKRDPQMIFDF